MKQATRTSLDRYSSILVMENKLVTKQVLANAGLRVPDGYHFLNGKEAKTSWSLLRNKPIVVKPKSTNFGLGITILKQNEDPGEFERAIDFAFEQDHEILIEHFVSGKEYRFFLIGGQVVAVLHRVPANVVGDGVLRIRDLVERKNADPMRGHGYRTPLEKIQLGQAEAGFLRSQNMDFETVPDEGQRVYLRENSNISTGGDSIDYTESVHPSYFHIASRAASAVGVNITGADIMIENILEPASEENYSIIEMNFNPAIHIHCFPHEGKHRPLDALILNQLGFV